MIYPQNEVYQAYPLLYVNLLAAAVAANVYVYYGRAVTIVTALDGTPLIVTSDIHQYLYWLSTLSLRVRDIKYYVPVPGNAYQHLLERMK
jgi:hypothetical protein